MKVLRHKITLKADIEHVEIHVEYILEVLKAIYVMLCINRKLTVEVRGAEPVLLV